MNCIEFNSFSQDKTCHIRVTIILEQRGLAVITQFMVRTVPRNHPPPPTIIPTLRYGYAVTCIVLHYFISSRVKSYLTFRAMLIIKVSIPKLHKASSHEGIRRSGDRAPHVPKFGTIWSSVVSFTTQYLISEGRTPGLQDSEEGGWGNLLPLLENEPRFFGHNNITL
jgi:hypothetical protein